jgi:predicted nucleotidyltransferase
MADEQSLREREEILSTAEDTSSASFFPERLVSTLREVLPRLLHAEPVRLAYLFGSTAAGRTTPLSDVDLALLVDDELVPGGALQLILKIQAALYGYCDISNSDVRIINDASLVFQGRVVSDGILVYARDEQERIDYEVRTRLLYFDYLPVHRSLQDAFFARLRERGLDG